MPLASQKGGKEDFSSSRTTPAAYILLAWFRLPWRMK